MFARRSARRNAKRRREWPHVRAAISMASPACAGSNRPRG